MTYTLRRHTEFTSLVFLPIGLSSSGNPVIMTTAFAFDIFSRVIMFTGILKQKKKPRRAYRGEKINVEKFLK